MNHNVPDWNFEGDVSMCNQKKPGGPEHELVELLWRNGQVVLQSQTNRRPSIASNESKQVQKPDHQAIKGDGSYGIPSTLIQDDDTVSWIHYPLEDSFEKEFCSNFFSDLPSSDPIEEEKFGSSDALNGFHNSSQQPKSKPSSTNVTCVEKQMPPPRLQYCNNNSAPQNNNDNNLGELGKVVNFSQFTIPGKGSLRCSSGQLGGKDQSQGGEVRECSIMTVGSSHCGSNQIIPEPDMSRASSKVDGTNVGLSTKQLKEGHVHVQKILPQSEGGKKEIVDPTFTSSSGGSGSSFVRTCQQSAGDNNTNNKRKNRDAEESECQSEAAELESAGTKKSSQRSGLSRRSRAAEVHNLSERRRRDRIKERMKALQELIPHCTKTDKASLLDEAIEYLKSLQLQLQVMWMGSGMAPMMFPGMQHYMSRMGMGMSPPAMPSIPNPMHMTRVPLVDPQTTNHQPVLCPTPVLNPINYQNQMQNTSFPEQYARFMSFHPMQTVSQPINMFSRLGCQTVQQGQSIPQQGISSRPFSGSTTSIHNGLSGKIELGRYYYPILSKFESYPNIKANMRFELEPMNELICCLIFISFSQKINGHQRFSPMLGQTLNGLATIKYLIVTIIC